MHINQAHLEVVLAQEAALVQEVLAQEVLAQEVVLLVLQVVGHQAQAVVVLTQMLSFNKCHNRVNRI